VGPVGVIKREHPWLQFRSLRIPNFRTLPIHLNDHGSIACFLVVVVGLVKRHNKLSPFCKHGYVHVCQSVRARGHVDTQGNIKNSTQLL